MKEEIFGFKYNKPKYKFCHHCHGVIWEDQYRYSTQTFKEQRYCTPDCARDGEITKGLNYIASIINKNYIRGGYRGYNKDNEKKI